MKSVAKIVVILSLIFSSADLIADDSTIPVIVVEMGNTNQVISVRGLNESFEKLQTMPRKAKMKRLSKKSFQKKLNKTIEKIGKVVSKAMLLDTMSKSKYELSEVDVSISLSSEAGFGQVFTVGGAGGIVLHFVK
ncbi:MAG: hypothetical protein KAG61_00880 [Bacteriovoracaceae bacterium]|nr:hypothetical protein [Bacteriovoracaceae bacterium]